MANLTEHINTVVEDIVTAQTLTTSYVQMGSVINIQGANTVSFVINYTKGSSTAFRLKFEFSNDGVYWGQEPEKSQSGGETTYTANERVFPVSADATFADAIPVYHAWMRVSAKAITSGTGTSLLLQIGKSFA